MERDKGNRDTEQRYQLHHREPAAVHRLQLPCVGRERDGTQQTQPRVLLHRHAPRKYVSPIVITPLLLPSSARVGSRIGYETAQLPQRAPRTLPLQLPLTVSTTFPKDIPETAILSNAL